jgi:phenylpropionate dioxygenase-like ring-hydroxylating dioxygenase large terminal subunit
VVEDATVQSARFENTHPGLRRFWHPVALAGAQRDDEPLAVQLLGERWVLVRLGGALTALRDRCPHRFAPLSAGCVVDGAVQCPYHGYRFAADGRCVAIPALGPGAAIPPKAKVDVAHAVVERYGLLWVALEAPLAPIIEVPEWDAAEFDAWHLEPRTAPITAAVLMDNFIDATHFPYLHRATFGAEDEGRPELESARDGWTVTVVNRGQPNSSPIYGTAEALQTYVIVAPFSLRIEVQLPFGTRNTFLFLLQPVDATTSCLYSALCYSDTAGDPDAIAEVSAFNNQVLDEDLRILSTLADPRLPLDLRAEVHTKRDLGTVEYRRVIADIAALGG